MRRDEAVALLGDILLVVVLLGLVGYGEIQLSSIFSAAPLILLGAIVSLTAWGFRARIERFVKGGGKASLPSPRETTPAAGKPQQVAVPSTTAPRTEILYDETKILSSGENEVYPLDLKKGDKITGTIESDIPIDYFFMLADEYDSFEENEDVEAEDQSSQITRLNLNLECPKRGSWVIVLDNLSEDDAEVDVKLMVIRGTPMKGEA